MSNNLLAAASYIRLLLDPNTSKTQVKALLHTANDQHLNAICEIAYNLLHSKLPLSLKAKSVLKSHQRVLLKLSDKTVTVRDKANYIRRKLTAVFHILYVSRKLILNYLG